MVLSRSRALFTAIAKTRQITPQIVRKSHGTPSYRIQPPSESKFLENAGLAIASFGWWWVFWHLYHEPDHLFGEFVWVDPSTFTDAELGIPSEE